MIVINSTDATSLSFEMNIEGNASKIGKVFLCMETKHGFDIRIPAKFENNTVDVTIPQLENIVEAGEYSVTLEVNIDGKTYIPLQESVLVEHPVQVKAKVSEGTRKVEESTDEPKIKTGSLSKAILSEIKKY